MIDWLNTDFEKTIRDFDYTRMATRGFERIITSGSFADMDSDMIYEYLLHGMEIVSFKDYLKRYIYERAGFPIPFREVADQQFYEVLATNFHHNNAPWSFKQTTKSLSQTLKGWLKQESARRNTVFLLGFGLAMPVDDVSEFLTKVIREEDFDFTNPEELVYWFCYRFLLSYADAKQILEEFERNPVEKLKLLKGKDFSWKDVTEQKDFEKNSRKYLGEYLYTLKRNGLSGDRNADAYREFLALYDRSRDTIVTIYQQEQEERKKTVQYQRSDIGPSDVERVLLSGVPHTPTGNLSKSSSGLLSRQFDDKRPDRHRIDNILKKKFPVNRFDLITLLFLVYSQDVEPDWPAERFMLFVDEINSILKRSHMLELYPANPYEAFISMCLVSDSPLSVYADIWEMSYGS